MFKNTNQIEVHINDSTFTIDDDNNELDVKLDDERQTGAIHLAGGQFNFQNCEFTHLVAKQGSVLFSMSDSDNIYIKDSLFQHNKAE